MKNNPMSGVGTKIGKAMCGLAIVFAVICAGAVCILFGTVCVIVVSNEADDRQALEQAKEKFSDVLVEFDGLFTVTNAKDNDSRGKRTIYFKYNGDPESFFRLY